LEIVIALFMGATLAACSGFRAFLPLLVLGLSKKLGIISSTAMLSQLGLDSTFGWVSSDPAILCFAVATLLEILSDKIPAVDHALDALLLVVRPAAGALSMLAVLPGQQHMVAYVAALLVGAGLAIPGQAVKAGIRVGASSMTLGALNPILSVLEDIVALLGSCLALILPVVAFCLVTMTLVISFLLIRHWRVAQRRAQPAA
jgi:hypothetical protein